MERSPVESLEPRRLLAAPLAVSDVRQILAQAASQALSSSLDKIVIAVADREGNVLGIFGRSGLLLVSADDPPREANAIVLNAVARARTAALFASRDNAFTTRTARFIIQDHFPTPVKGTPGGPLYGVQFSNLVGSDVVRNGPAISGDPGGIPLFRDGEPIGGIGVAGDFNDVAARADLIDLTPDYAANPGRRVFAGKEESDVDEQIALAGAAGYMAPKSIQATGVSIDGLKLPFTHDEARSGAKFFPLKKIMGNGLGVLLSAPDLGKPTPDAIAAPAVPYPAATFAGVTGRLKRQDTRLAPEDQQFGIVSSDDPFPSPQRLLYRDVAAIIERGVKKATETRAGIRLPIGRPVSVHLAVVDRDGDLLGVFGMGDGTNFSFDVAVQKARTAAFFSDDRHAFSTRAVGFLSQQFMPIGIDTREPGGALYQVQNALSPGLVLRGTRSGQDNPLRNGITVFAGGVPLYKNGVLVGGIGVSGDGIDQDDLVAFTAAGKLGAPQAIRSDALSNAQIRSHVAARAAELFELFGRRKGGKWIIGNGISGEDVRLDVVLRRLDRVDFRLPFVKFPRNPAL